MFVSLLFTMSHNLCNSFSNSYTNVPDFFCYATSIHWWYLCFHFHMRIRLHILVSESHNRYRNNRLFGIMCVSCSHLWRYCCAGGPHVRCRRPWWLELSQHSGALGPTGQTVELRGQHVHAQEHHGSHSTEWEVSCQTRAATGPTLLYLKVCKL